MASVVVNGSIEEISSTVDADNGSVTTSKKPGKFPLLKKNKPLFIQLVNMHEVHSVSHKKKEEYFTKALNTLVCNIPPPI